MASVFKAAADREIADQPRHLRHKGSILIVLSGVAGVLADLATSADIKELGWGTTFSIAATVVAFVINRFTKDGITPSMASRLEHAGLAAFEDRLSESGVTVTHPVVEETLPAGTDINAVEPGHVSTSQPPQLPTYYGESTAD